MYIIHSSRLQGIKPVVKSFQRIIFSDEGHWSNLWELNNIRMIMNNIPFLQRMWEILKENTRIKYENDLKIKKNINE
jgi:hypothetical protein